ncbi:membrane protein required for colicin V production [Sphingomonas sp. BE138]|uniref:CvpA family protein n=1 Tax=Sphingomonas sp. BE138 TaxID=2817845 RepID=UPI00286391E8|nr:CvpA family protein [Sphingomonas sp. BE138]MDR6789497.1 membrane protein required for colicin V production [Sphingomonas sp. BE138]
MNLEPLDIVVLVLVALAAIGGARRGFVGEVLALFAWVAMIFALKIFHLPLAQALAGTVASVSGAAVLAFVLLTGGTYVVSRIVINAIAARTRTSVLGPIDRALGFGFGALKGLILASLAYLFLILALDLAGGGPTRRPAWLTTARTYPLLAATSGAVADFVDRRRKGQPVFGSRTPSRNGEPSS